MAICELRKSLRAKSRPKTKTNLREVNLINRSENLFWTNIIPRLLQIYTEGTHLMLKIQ